MNSDVILETTKVDFPKLADQITTEYFSKGTPLSEGVIKLAKENNFNPEEIKRLTEKTNTSAVVKMLKTAEDKKATIPVVDYASVIARTHPSEEREVVKIASSNFSIPETRINRQLRAVKFSAGILEKTASEQKKRILPEIFKTQRIIEETTQEKIAAEVSAQDGIDYIISEFYKYNAPDFSKFASEAHAMVGKKAKYMLDKMAEYLSAKVEYEDLSYVDDRDPLLQKFAGVIENLEKLAHLEAKRKDLKEQLDNLWAEAKQNGR